MNTEKHRVSAAASGADEREPAASVEAVKANKGAAGVDGLDIARPRSTSAAWPAIREQLVGRTGQVRSTGDDPETGRRRARAGHPDGDGSADPASAAASAATAAGPHLQRTQLRLPAGRRAHDAVLGASGYVQSGKMVVDVDLEKFFDRVNHDILMDRLGGASMTLGCCG
jgi:RNA-directed DNA polymerase